MFSYKRPQTVMNVHNSQRTWHHLAGAKYGGTGGGPHYANGRGATAVQISMFTANRFLTVRRWPVTQKIDSKRLPYFIHIHIKCNFHAQCAVLLPAYLKSCLAGPVRRYCGNAGYAECRTTFWAIRCKFGAQLFDVIILQARRGRAARAPEPVRQFNYPAGSD